MLFALLLTISAANEADPIVSSAQGRQALDRVFRVTPQAATAVASLPTDVATPAFVAARSDDVAPTTTGGASLRQGEQWRLGDLFGWLFAALAGIALAIIVAVTRRHSAKTRREAHREMQALEKRLRVARTVADSERQWLNEQYRELQAKVERMAQEAKSERTMSLVGGALPRTERGFRPLQPMRTMRPDREALPQVPAAAQRMMDAFDKASDHLQSVQDAAASLVPQDSEREAEARPTRQNRPRSSPEGSQTRPDKARRFRPARRQR